MKISVITVLILLWKVCAVYSQTLTFASRIDPGRFSGLWYEVSVYPADIRKGCRCTTIEFEYIPGNNFFKAITRCIQFRKGTTNVTRLSSRLILPADTSRSPFKFHTPGLLKKENFQILVLSADYYFVVLVNPEKKSIFLLCRDSFIPTHLYNEILKVINDKGYHSSAMQKTPQNCDIVE